MGIRFAQQAGCDHFLAAVRASHDAKVLIFLFGLLHEAPPCVLPTR